MGKDEIEKMDRRNQIMNAAYVVGLVVASVVALGLCGSMLVSAY